MIRPVLTLALLAMSCSLANAQNPPSPQQLQKSYDEALAQLKAAQDRKNELATENQKLQKQLEDVSQQLKAVRADLETLENRVYFLREHYAIWQRFLEMNESIRAMWTGYFNSVSSPTIRMTDILGDGQWPFSVEGGRGA